MGRLNSPTEPLVQVYCVDDTHHVTLLEGGVSEYVKAIKRKNRAAG